MYLGVPAQQDENGKIILEPMYYGIVCERSGFLDNEIRAGFMRTWELKEGEKE